MVEWNIPLLLTRFLFYVLSKGSVRQVLIKLFLIIEVWQNSGLGVANETDPQMINHSWLMTIKKGGICYHMRPAWFEQLLSLNKLNKHF